MKVLLVEDDRDMALHLRQSLEEEGHDVEHVEDGQTAEDLANIRHKLGLDRPLYIQYGHFLWHVLHGDLGVVIRDLHAKTAAPAVAE